MVKKTYFNFQHDYYKLKENEFTTIRGKTAAKQYDVLQIVDITKDRKFFCKAVILGILTAPISEFKLEILKKDAEYPGFEITSEQQFVDLINSFNPPHYEQATVNSDKTLFKLKKIICKGFDTNYKHCLTCKQDGSLHGKLVCFSSKEGEIQPAKPCQNCGGYYPGDCKCPQPCSCDSCKEFSEMQIEASNDFDEAEKMEEEEENIWFLMEEEYS